MCMSGEISVNNKVSPSATVALSNKKITQQKETTKCFDEGDYYSTEKNEFDPTKGEQALWRAVITQALMDAGSNSNKTELKYEKAQAIAWLSGRSSDFHEVCALAGLEPSYVKRKAREAIERGCIWREEMKVVSSESKIVGEVPKISKERFKNYRTENENIVIETKSLLPQTYAVHQQTW